MTMKNTDAGQQPTPEQATTISDLQQQLDELKANIDREVTRRVKNTLHSNADLKIEVRNLRAEVTDLRASNKAVTGERDKLHSELVEVRSALATVSEERDSLRTTLASWEAADTAPFVKVPDVADHVVPPVLHVGEPDPVNDPKDAALEFRNVVPTPEMLKHVGYWDLVSGAAAIAFKPGGLRLVFWRIAGSQEWRTDPCPQPLKPHGMTWQQLDRALANTKSVPPVLPLCNVCHECGSELANCSQGTNHHDCPRPLCPRTCTGRHGGGFSPYSGPCKSATPVRHE